MLSYYSVLFALSSMKTFPFPDHKNRTNILVIILHKYTQCARPLSIRPSLVHVMKILQKRGGSIIDNYPVVNANKLWYTGKAAQIHRICQTLSSTQGKLRDSAMVFWTVQSFRRL